MLFRSPGVLCVLLAMAQVKASDERCVRVSSPEKLRLGQSLSLSLPARLEFRLVPEGDWGWDIRVVDPDTPSDDYMWLVSPPYQHAPHRGFGRWYNMTPSESASFERELHFVLNRQDYERMLAVHRAPYNPDDLIRARETTKKGVLRLRVTDFGTRKVVARDGRHADAFDWITFDGEACVPR